MEYIFYIFSFFSILSTICVILQKNAVHALLYLIVSFLSMSAIFFLLGAFFIGALEVIIYAGAIMVLFIFVIMMLNLGEQYDLKEKKILTFMNFIGPSILSFILFIVMLYVIFFLKDH
ncbi:MAG: NADH-quinone oxidoreductase subunit J, partial [Buchnera aphidicola]|nr:NADH-quinone oxidoreductase subunit J [Buchnera aphidicola]